jgi:spore germination protein YaaH
VLSGTVVVNDFVRRLNLVLHAGHTYLALAKPAKHK